MGAGSKLAIIGLASTAVVWLYRFKRSFYKPAVANSYGDYSVTYIGLPQLTPAVITAHQGDSSQLRDSTELDSGYAGIEPPASAIATDTLRQAAATAAETCYTNTSQTSSQPSHNTKLCVHLLPADVKHSQELLLQLLNQELSSTQLLGLDTEWQPEVVPGTHNKISLVQLASSQHCLLLRPLLTAPLPTAWRQVLEDPGVIKAGVGMQEDIKRLQKDHGLLVKGAVDVRLVAQQHAPWALAGGSSLQALSLALLGHKLDKSQQCSDWGAARLTQQQVAYAAHDAWLSRELLLALYHISQHTAGHSTEALQPPHPDADMPDVSGDPHGDVDPQALRHFVAPYLDRFTGLKKAKGCVRNTTGAAGTHSAGTPNGVTGPAGVGSKVKVPKPSKLPTRQSALYENCRILAPDGTVLCTCGRKKVQWYLDRGLATLVSSEPWAIELKFEPRGRGHADDQYYLCDKENRCCVCGASGEYLRHNVVPHCYRQHFPRAMKSHLSHDIVLLCTPCHQLCGVYDQRRMGALGEQHGAPVALDCAKYRYDTALSAVRSAARALSNTKITLPTARQLELQAVLLQHYGVDTLSPQLLAEACEVDPRQADSDWSPHAERVVGSMSAADIPEFVKGWRAHFLQAMQPRFLSPHWSVDSRVINSSAAGQQLLAEQ